MDSWWLKLDRACSQIQEIHRLTDELVEKQQARFSVHHDIEVGQYTIGITNVSEPPAAWGIIVGEIAHNLRSALDHVVYQLVLVNRARNGLEKPPPDNKIAFPIFSQQSSYPANGGVYLVGAPDGAIRAIYDIQPFNFDDRPHFLERLAILNDIDKHRLLHHTFLVPHDWDPTFTALDNFEFRWRVTRPHSPIEEAAIQILVTPPPRRAI